MHICMYFQHKCILTFCLQQSHQKGYYLGTYNHAELSLQRDHLLPLPVGHSNEVPYYRGWYSIWNNIYGKKKKTEVDDRDVHLNSN